MRICISSQGQSLADQFDERFGRSQYLLVVDPSTLEVEAAKNPGLAAEHGAGIAAAQHVIDTKAHVLITGHLGANAEGLLSGSRLAVYQGREGTVRSVLDAFTAGQLQRMLPTSGGGAR